MNLLDQPRITQLISTYSPDSPPTQPLGFGDFLSILWRLDLTAAHEGRSRYYRACAITLSEALGFKEAPLGVLMRSATPGDVYKTLGQVPYRSAERLVDATDRRAAIQQMIKMRVDVLTMGIYEESWAMQWPGRGIADPDLRDRVHAVLFTAMPSQYPVFARLLFVVDIVLQDLLTGSRKQIEFDLATLITEYNYPDPQDPDVQLLYSQEQLL